MNKYKFEYKSTINGIEAKGWFIEKVYSNRDISIDEQNKLTYPYKASPFSCELLAHEFTIENDTLKIDPSFNDCKVYASNHPTYSLGQLKAHLHDIKSSHVIYEATHNWIDAKKVIDIYIDNDLTEIVFFSIDHEKVDVAKIIRVPFDVIENYLKGLIE